MLTARRALLYQVPFWMKATPLVLVAIMVLAAPARSQEVERTISQDGSTLPSTEGIPEESESLPLPTIKFTPPPPPKEVPPMVVKASTVLQLPTHRITVLRGEASTLPDIPSPPVSLPQIAAPAGEPQYMFSFGATIYDHQLSHVQWRNPKTQEEFEAWCGWDWGLLSPISQIEHDTKSLLFFLFPSNVDTTKMVRLGRGFKIPAHPEVPADGFVITKGDPNNLAEQGILTTIRDYYLKHKARLILIQQAQEKYQADAAAWLAAHPPKPESHTFWLKPHRGSRYLKPVNEGGDQ